MGPGRDDVRLDRRYWVEPVKISESGITSLRMGGGGMRYGAVAPYMLLNDVTGALWIYTRSSDQAFTRSLARIMMDDLARSKHWKWIR